MPAVERGQYNDPASGDHCLTRGGVLAALNSCEEEQAGTPSTMASRMKAALVREFAEPLKIVEAPFLISLNISSSDAIAHSTRCVK